MKRLGENTMSDTKPESTKSLLDWDEAEDNSTDAEFEQDFAAPADVPKACSISQPDCEACQ